MAPEKLIVFDYSGTLSLAAPRFGRADNLVRVLAETGLAGLGIATPELFWSQIVAPTWVAGSTTRTGYGQVMAERIAALRPTSAAERERIGAAAARFVTAYLEHSPIDRRWRPILRRLVREGASLQVIATDHYAEATAAIVGQLQALAIAATPVAVPEGGSAAPTVAGPEGRTGLIRNGEDRQGAAEGGSGFIIANSADLGVWKRDRRFWELLKARLPGAPRRGLLVLDDFGLNEEAGDRYGLLAQVAARQEETLAVLREVFGEPVDLFPFFLPAGTGGEDAGGRRLIAAAAERIERFLK